jgi:hypothetical protein
MLEVDRRGAIKKIQDVVFDPLHATSAFEVRTYQPLLRSSTSMMHDDALRCLMISAKNLSKFMVGFDKGRKRNMIFFIFHQNALVRGRSRLLLASQP